MADQLATPKVGVLGLPRPALIIIAVEFAEQLGYYAVAFSLHTYGRHMLGVSASGMFAIINVVYLVIPAAACVSSGMADGTWGRVRSLKVFLLSYATGLVLLTASSLPWAFHDFPYGALAWNYVAFALALGFFAVGYGGMKVCVQPMMADSVTSTYKRLFAEERDHEPHGDSASGECSALCSAPTTTTTTINASSSSVESSMGESHCEREADDRQKRELERVLTRAFQGVYWMSNLSSFFGVFLAPMMRGLDRRRILVGSVESTTGYYFGFTMATVSVLVGLVFFYRFAAEFPRNDPAPPFLFFRLLGRAVYVRVGFALGRIHDDHYQRSVGRDGFLAYGFYHRGWRAEASASVVILTDADADAAEDAEGPRRQQPPPEEETGEGEERGGDAAEADEQWLADLKATLRVCKSFVALPVYWLITNQYSTSLMFSIEALRLPPPIAPEVFNNINTLALLVFIALYDRVVSSHAFQRRFHGHGPSPRTRIAGGFLINAAAMLWCGAVQIGIAHRGHYMRVEGVYEVYEGRAKLSAGWLVLPFLLQGVAAALVDPASMEVAYTEAPVRMKGTVMALYWVASSASGLLGLVLSPVMKPENGVALYFSFAAVLLVATVVFARLNIWGGRGGISLSCAEGGSTAITTAAASAPPEAAPR